MFVNSGATDIVLVTLSSTAVERAIAQCTSRWAMARGHRLNTSIVLAAVHGLSGLFRAVSAVEPFTLSPPSRSVPVPNRPTRLCGRKATLNLSPPSDFCAKVGSYEIHFNVFIIVRDKVTRQSPQTTTFEEKGERKRIRTEVPPLTSLTPYR